MPVGKLAEAGIEPAISGTEVKLANYNEPLSQEVDSRTVAILYPFYNLK